MKGNDKRKEKFISFGSGIRTVKWSVYNIMEDKRIETETETIERIETETETIERIETETETIENISPPNRPKKNSAR